jgi:hypothetical protein
VRHKCAAVFSYCFSYILHAICRVFGRETHCVVLDRLVGGWRACVLSWGGGWYCCLLRHNKFEARDTCQGV